MGLHPRCGIVLVLSLVVATGIADAEPTVGQSEDSLDCSSGGRTQREMGLCAARAAQSADAKLESLLEELGSKLGQKEGAQLVSVQTRWAELRDLDCDWERSFFLGGSAAPLVYAKCLKARTDERIDRLKILLCEGAGMTGPCAASEKY